MLIKLSNDQQQWHIITDEWSEETLCGQAVFGDGVKGYIPKGRSQEPFLVCPDCLRANAALIVAAPRLLAALEAADAALCNHPGGDNRSDEDVELARAALAAARGEEA